MNEKKSERSKKSSAAKGVSAPAPSPLRDGFPQAAASDPASDRTATFEQALTRLETIVQELEGGDLTLEETLSRYEEGSRLAAECARRLEEAEQRIKVLSSSPDTPSRPEADGGDEEEGDGPTDSLPF